MENTNITCVEQLTVKAHPSETHISLNQGDIYVCCGNGNVINEFSLFAKIVRFDPDNGVVLVERKTKFGFVDNGSIKLNIANFLNYYKKIC